jgi:gluconokinase
MVNAIYPVFKLMLLKEQGYDLKDYLILGQGTYNYFCLT